MDITLARFSIELLESLTICKEKSVHFSNTCHLTIFVTMPPAHYGKTQQLQRKQKVFLNRKTKKESRLEKVIKKSFKISNGK